MTMANGKRPIGDVQRHVLWKLTQPEYDRLGHPAGTWFPGCGWHWETKSRTERIMESLRLRGMVTARERVTTDNGRKVRYTEYTITDEGRKHAGKPDVFRSPTKR
jgi:hypothetical protein